MIDENKLRDLFEINVLEGAGDCHWYYDAREMIDTISAALKVVRAAQEVVKNSSGIWGVSPLVEALKPFSPPEGEEGR